MPDLADQHHKLPRPLASAVPARRDDHELIIRALCDRDEAAARRAMESHRAIMVVGVEQLGDPARTNLDQPLFTKRCTGRYLRLSWRAGPARDSCVSKDRGDGTLILIPPECRGLLRPVQEHLLPRSRRLHR